VWVKGKYSQYLKLIFHLKSKNFWKITISKMRFKIKTCPNEMIFISLERFQCKFKVMGSHGQNKKNCLKFMKAWKLWIVFPSMTPNHLESNLKIKSSLMEFTICNTNHQWNIYINVMKTYYQNWFTKKWQKGRQKKPSKGYYKAINIMHVNN